MSTTTDDDLPRDRPPVSGAVIAGWITCAAIGVGAAGTWASLGLFSVNGLDDGRDGILTLIAGVLAALAIWRCFRKAGSRAWIAVLLLGLLVSAIAFYDISDISSTGGEFFGEELEVTVGWGLVLTAVAGVALTIVGIVLGAQARGRRTA